MANEVNIKINADDMASGKISGLNNRLKSMRGTFLGVAAAGGAVTGVLGMMTKSSLDQQIGINQLDNALKNVNTSYAENKTAIEEAISATQAKTNFGDEEQRQSLARIISLTGDNTNALDALAVSTDLASAMGMDLSNASLLVAKALSGQTSSLTRYGISLEEGASKTEILEALQKQFAGSAEAAADPTTQLGNRIGDLAQSIGDVLLPVLETIVPMIDRAVQKVIAFSEANPTLTKTLVIGAGALGAIALALGTLGLAIPPIITALTGLKTAFVVLKVAMMGNPFIAIATVLIALATITIPLVIKNFDKIKDAVFQVVNATMPFIEAFINSFVSLINILIEGFNKINIFGDDIDTLTDVTLPRFERSVDKVNESTEALGKGVEKQSESILDAYFRMQQGVDGQIDKQDELVDAIAQDRQEIRQIEQKHYEHLQTMRIADQKAAEAVANGTTKTFKDFFKEQEKLVMAMPDTFLTGRRELRETEEAFFRRRQQEVQGDPVAQAELARQFRQAGGGGDPTFNRQTIEAFSKVTGADGKITGARGTLFGSLHGGLGSINPFDIGMTQTFAGGKGGAGQVNIENKYIIIEGDYFGIDDFEAKQAASQISNIESGIIEPTSSIT